MSTPLDSTWADRALVLTTVAYLLINGAGIFETAVIVPVWTSAPPASLAMFAGPHALDFKAFWITAHSLHELTFIAAIALNWRTARRTPLLLLFAAHALIRIWTIVYFAPTIIEMQSLAGKAGGVDPALLARAQTWAYLNWLRTGAFVMLSFILVAMLRSPAKSRRPSLERAAAAV
jgi:hypothetical protein